MIKKSIFFAVLAFMMLGCSYDNRNMELVKKDSNSLTANDLTVNIQGVNISLNRNIQDVVESSNGKLKYDEKEEKVQPGGNLYTYFLNNNGEKNRAIILRNTGEEEIDIQDTTIESIDVSYKDAEVLDIVLPDGIEFGDSYESILKKYGEPSEYHTAYRPNQIQYFDSSEKNIALQLEFVKNKLTRFQLVCLTRKAMDSSSVESFKTKDAIGYTPIYNLKLEVLGNKRNDLQKKEIEILHTKINSTTTLSNLYENGWKKIKTDIDTLSEKGYVTLKKNSQEILVTTELDITEKSLVEQISISDGDVQVIAPGNVSINSLAQLIDDYGTPSACAYNKSNNFTINYRVENFEIAVEFNENKVNQKINIYFDRIG